MPLPQSQALTLEGPDPYSGLSAAIKDTRADAAGLGGLKARFMSDVENLGPERRRLGGQSSLQAANASAQGGSPTFAGSLANALRIAKVRQGIMSKGDEAIRHQQFRDRISVARLAMGQRQRGISSLANAANIREGVNLANAEAGADRSASNASLLGGILGAGVSAYKNRDPQTGVTGTGTGP